MKKTKTLVASLIAIVMCFTMIIGTTFAWFTDSVTNTNNIITSGNVDVELWHCDFNGSLPFGFGYVEENGKQVDESTKLFLNVEGNDILWEPGASASETFRIKNVGSLAFKYEFRVKVLNKTITLDDKSLTDVVKLQAVELEYDQNNIPVGAGLYDENVNIANDYVIAGELLSGEYVDYYISLDWFSTENDNDYANLKMNVGIELVATQLMFENDGTGSDYDKDAQFPEITYPDTLDGEPNIAWYTANPNATEFTLTSAEDFAGLQQLIDGTATIPTDVTSEITFPVTFEGQTIKLDTDVNLYQEDEKGNRITFSPIGHSSNGQSFKGTFDGQGHTIKNVYMQNDLSAWQYEGEYYGLFAFTEGATIKNVNIDGAYISSGRNEAACVVGNAVDTTFEDINITNSTLIAYNNSAGGVAAECYGTCSFTNITVDEKTVIGPLWGTYDVRLGGIVGLVHRGNDNENNVTFKDITVSCKLDAINDVAANYQYWLYRYCGMLIGHVDGVNGVADPTGYVTCENVTVNYGDWVNYHYCELESLGAGSYNGPGEYKYTRVEAGTGTDGIDINNCQHTENESHNVLIVFDQLFGGGQGVKGLKTYDGVTVNYNK